MDHRPIVLARWKAYQPFKDIQNIIQNSNKKVDEERMHLYHALPFTLLMEWDPSTIKPGVGLGADNMLASGPHDYAAHFVGKMLTDANANFVVIGDRDQRQFFQESDESIGYKLRCAIGVGRNVVLCVEDPALQLPVCLAEVSPEQLPLVLIVYQGPWAGFYSSDTLPQQLNGRREQVREVLSSLFGDTGLKAPVLLALPSRFDHAEQLVAETIGQCDGYYLSNALFNPEGLGELIKAVNAYEIPPPMPSTPTHDKLPSMPSTVIHDEPPIEEPSED